MSLKLLKKLAGLMAMGLLIVAALGASESSNSVEKSAVEEPTRREKLKIQLDKRLDDLYQVLGEAMKKNDSKPSADTLRQSITKLSNDKGFSVRFDERTGYDFDKSFFVVAFVNFESYTIGVARRLGVYPDNSWYVATPIGESYVYNPSYEDGGSKEVLDSLLNS